MRANRAVTKAKMMKTRSQAKQSIPRPAKPRNGKWPHDPRNPYRPGCSYATCYDILASHKNGMPKNRLVVLLAKATGKDIRHGAYDAQIVLSARPNDDGLSNNNSHRNRSCRPGYWIKRTNGHVQLMVD